MNSLNSIRFNNSSRRGLSAWIKRSPATWLMKVVQFSGDIPAVILTTEPPGQNRWCGLGITLKSHFVER